MITEILNEEQLLSVLEIEDTDLLKDRLYITRYQKNEDLLKSINNDSVYFSNPEQWDDPFEEAVVKHLNERKLNIYGICFTISASKNEEAFWRTCKEGNKLLVSYSFKYEKFMNHLEKALKENFPNGEYKIYPGFINYSLMRKEIERTIGKKSITGMSNDELVKLLFNKRIAYSYENEFRIIIAIKSDEANKTGLSVEKFDLETLLCNVRLEPLPKELLKMIKDKKDKESLKNKYIEFFKTTISDECIRKKIKVSVSRLDDFSVV